MLSRERGLFSIALSLKKRVGSISHPPAYILISLYDIGFGVLTGRGFLESVFFCFHYIVGAEGFQYFLTPILGVPVTKARLSINAWHAPPSPPNHMKSLLYSSLNLCSRYSGVYLTRCLTLNPKPLNPITLKPQQSSYCCKARLTGR